MQTQTTAKRFHLTVPALLAEARPPRQSCYPSPVSHRGPRTYCFLRGWYAMGEQGNAAQIASQRWFGVRHVEPRSSIAKQRDAPKPCSSEDPKALMHDRIQAPVVGDASWGCGNPLQTVTLSRPPVNGVEEKGVSLAGRPCPSAGGATVLLPVSGNDDLGNRARSFKQQRLLCVPSLNINTKLCLGCASDKVVTQHPLFPGSLCLSCKVNYVISVYLFDDGYHSYCAICGRGVEILLCESANCWRVFCTCCMDRLLGLGTARRAKALHLWQCYLCRPLEAGSPLSLRHDWALRLRDLIADEGAVGEEPRSLLPPLVPAKKAAVRVVTLFDDNNAACNALRDFKGLIARHVQCRLSNNRMKAMPTIDHGKVIHTDVSTITGKHVQQWGPFTLLLGGHCLLEDDTGETLNRFFYEFFHLVRMTRPGEHEARARPFFWLLTVLEAECFCGPMNNQEISRFLAMPPVEIFSSHRQVTCYMWGNLPCLDRICNFYGDLELEPQESWQEDLENSWHLAYEPLRRALAPLHDYFRFE
ncbi:DNA (cytosine-5)-methyltransferase 3-like isoform X1 [Petromyzon marinus]|uniref:DNA (Cytosine-5)-methyltransferase 3B-like isoform X1 n=2 Tax=Petromyzon marinus TaxID=7757 RepID=A0AAJ7SXN7_PETMA|nr:DNA (cytosine-5)-methyltransferase 3B-like isoform X1 [Petromyzon marinus]XP_032806666.1 DNA (cytosine-5)-methyltransferase 3B-like isoform X1 [Petromyzon marinus]XP_032806675.1 DNA (cytosine-5)-methyltransferase 3B-like isoform X1 [Petromyzon marinus]XP_032806685.1 DNA (cytosine-5)-methyltransferase 3B-like isoform X1 [Petromyzon marinus]